MKLIIARHAETKENAEDVTQGHYDSQLNYVGVKQSLFLAERLRNESLDLIVSSDLHRCMYTAGEVSRHHDAPIIVSPLLREQKRGVYERRPKKIAREAFHKAKVPYHEWCPPEGESLTDVWDRVIPFFERLHDAYSEKNVLLVGHGRPIACLLAYLDGKTIHEWQEYRPENTAVSVAHINGLDVEFDCVNCTNHLR